MSTSLFENFLIDFAEANGGIAEQSSEGTYTILYGPQHTLKTVTLELEAAKENPIQNCSCPGAIFLRQLYMMQLQKEEFIRLTYWDHCQS